MNDFLTGLLFYCTEQISPPSRDAQYLADREAFSELCLEIQTALGEDFLNRYQKASYQFGRWEDLAIFRQGLRFGAQYALEVLDQSSTSMP